MADTTAISWCDHTFNLWIGCEHASADDPSDPAMVDMTATSEECSNCYAETFDHRLGGRHWGHGAEPRWLSENYWAKLRQWNARAQRDGLRRRVFVSSLADWAQRHPDPVVNARMDGLRWRLWTEILACPWLDFLLLTKRAERLDELLPWYTAFAAGRMPRDDAQRALEDPWRNVWVGVTCGTRRSLWRIAELRKVRAAVRFVSCEPLLDHITYDDWDDALDVELRYPYDPRGRIHWLIVGDESGHGRRSTERAWVETARDAADRHGIAFHLKQLHEGGRKIHLPVLDGRQHAAFPRSAR